MEPQAAERAPGVVDVVARGEASVCVSLSGEIDAALARELDLAAREVERSGRAVLVDVTGVTFMDSSGVGLLARLAGPGQVLRVVGALESVRFLLEVAGLEQLLSGG